VRRVKETAPYVAMHAHVPGGTNALAHIATEPGDGASFEITHRSLSKNGYCPPSK
jgi:mannose-6-phosphate isomerase-like protein (cupin superfamily)